MNQKTFQKFLDRDQGRCLHCGRDDDALAPNHRKNRGMGGSKERDVPSNVVVLCSQFNGLIESSASAAAEALKNGWKLYSGQDPLVTPVFDVNDGTWYLLDDKFKRFRAH